MKNDHGVVDNHAVYVILGVDAEGFKEVLGLYISPTESKSTWMKIFDSIKARGELIKNLCNFLNTHSLMKYIADF